MPRSRTSRSAGRLPLALTPLLGRRREIEEIDRLLDGGRLLTITGAGGSGKTRLAVETARRADRRFDTIAWTDLATLSDPDLVAAQVLGSMGVREPGAEDILQVLLDTIRDRQTLIVLDNCEHLIDATAFVTEEILRSCPATSILATSREPLNVQGEQVWLVPPLTIEDAVELFSARARAVLPSFQLEEATRPIVTAICRRLDGIPLAIELAAARVNVLSPAEIEARLSDAFRLLSSGSRTLPRHRTIRETIDWSVRLLSSKERMLLRRLSVFAGTFSLEAAEMVCADEDVLTHLPALVDKSLVMAESGGYRLLDTVRQFAAGELETAGERDDLREKHAAYVLSVAEEAESRLFAGGDAHLLAHLDHLAGDLRLVFEWTAEKPARCEIDLRLVYALHWYWFARAQFHEARRRTTHAVARDCGADPGVRARAVVAAGNSAVWQADWQSVGRGLDEALDVLRDRGEAHTLANALMLAGVHVALARGDNKAAAKAFDESQEVARRGLERVIDLGTSDVGSSTSTAPEPASCAAALGRTLYWIGLTAQLRDDLPSAQASFEEASSVATAFDDKPVIGYTSAALGHLACQRGNIEEALSRFRRAIDVHSETENRWGMIQAIEGVGLTLLNDRTEEQENGIRLLAAASAAWMHIGAGSAREASFEEAKSSRMRAALGDERLRVVVVSGAAMSYEDMVAFAREQLDRCGTVRASAATLQVRALGPLQISRDGKSVDESARARELLLFLLCHPSGRTKEQIGAALWPDTDPARLRNNFHVTLHRLRKSLGTSDWIVVDGETYRLDRARPIDFDAETFEREATAALRSGSTERLTRSLELYRGGFFENATSGEWYLDVRDRLSDLRARALEALARARGKSGDHHGAAEFWQQLVALDELDEDAARHLVESLARAGDFAAAHRAWRRLAITLERELGEKPSFPPPAAR